MTTTDLNKLSQKAEICPTIAKSGKNSETELQIEKFSDDIGAGRVTHADFQILS